MRAHKSFVLAAVAIGTIADSATAQQPKPGATEPPKLASAKALTLPVMTERVLPNGLKLVVIPQTREACRP